MPSRFLRARGTDGSHPRVLVPYRTDGIGGHQSDKRDDALDILKDLHSTTAAHSSLLHELKEIYKHLRVELKDDIYDLVEQIRGTGAGGTGGTGGEGRSPQVHSGTAAPITRPWEMPKQMPESRKSSSARQSLVLPHIPDDQTRVTCVEDLEDMEDDEAEPLAEEKKSSVTSALAKRFAWRDSNGPPAPRDTTYSVIQQRRADVMAARSRSFAKVVKDDERMPAVPLEKRPYYSSVDLFNRALQDDDAGWLERMVRKDSFDYVMGSLLALNAVIIGIQVDLGATHPSDPAWSRAIDLIFCSIFGVELLVRILAFGRRFFSTDGWQWNLFDSVVVFFSVADEVTKLILSDSEVQEIFDSIGFLRLLRLGRIVRLVRMVRLIPALKSMVYLILASLKSFLWTVVLLVILMYCVAVYFTELAYDLRHKYPQKDFTSVEKTWGLSERDPLT